jgi:hypothetical protein
MFGFLPAPRRLPRAWALIRLIGLQAQLRALWQTDFAPHLACLPLFHTQSSHGQSLQRQRNQSFAVERRVYEQMRLLVTILIGEQPLVR